MKILKSSIFLLLVVALGCKTSRYTDCSLTLGKGGGFTGKYDEYKINGKGEVYKMDAASAGSSPVSLVKKLDKKTVTAVFKNVSALNIPEPEFNHPGNMTSYIEYYDGKTTHKIKWGDFKILPPDSIKAFFDETWTVIKN